MQKCIRVVPKIRQQWSLCASLCANRNLDKIYSWKNFFFMFDRGCGVVVHLYRFLQRHLKVVQRIDKFQNAIFLKLCGR